MSKKTIRTSVELLPGQTEAIQKIALELGYKHERGVFAGKLGSMSQLMRAIADGEIKVLKRESFDDLLHKLRTAHMNER